MWSMGCTFYELFTGKILFAASGNNELLKLIIELKGKYPNKLLKKALFKNEYYSGTNLFLVKENENLNVSRQIKLEKTQDLKRIILQSLKYVGNSNIDNLIANLNFDAGSFNSENFGKNLNKEQLQEIKEVVAFADLVDKMLILDPTKRIDPNNALIHNFFKE